MAGVVCCICSGSGGATCSGCNQSYHSDCLDLQRTQIFPVGQWLCPRCTVRLDYFYMIVLFVIESVRTGQVKVLDLMQFVGPVYSQLFVQCTLFLQVGR